MRLNLTQRRETYPALTPSGQTDDRRFLDMGIGGAWPFLVRGVICQVDSGNGRDSCRGRGFSLARSRGIHLLVWKASPTSRVCLIAPPSCSPRVRCCTVLYFCCCPRSRCRAVHSPERGDTQTPAMIPAPASLPASSRSTHRAVYYCTQRRPCDTDSCRALLAQKASVIEKER